MKTISALAEGLALEGVVCLSIRPPDRRTGTWTANTRVDDTGWRTSKPSPTLEAALRDVLRLTTNTEPVDDMEDLLG